MGATAAGLEQLAGDYLQNPHVVHERLREQGPVTKLVLPHGVRVWLVTRYEEARAALADPRLSKDLKANPAIFTKHLVDDREPREFNSELIYHMLNADPPDHTRLRKLVTKAFTARRMELMRPRVEELTAQLLDEMERHDEVDLLEAFAYPLPLTVICEILGIPLDDRDEFKAWTNALVTTVTPEAAQQAGLAMAQYLSAMTDRKREHPGEDMFSALVHADDESGDRLDHAELMSMAFLLLLAGHETTVNLIGNGVLNLLRHPDQLAALRADPSLIKGAVEEFLRYEGPVNQATARYTTEPITIGDVTIPTDELVIVSLVSANRDPERFADPDRFDITRQTGGHVAFGHGIHFCLGAPLARLEGEIAVNALLKRFPDLALAAEPDDLVWRSSTLVRGLFTLPVRLHS